MAGPGTRLNRWWRQALLAITACAALLPGCGGGVGTGGTGSFASGPITGFGSVIVNDVHFDDTQAAVEDGDGNRRSSAELRLGMTVDIEAGAISTGASGAVATATRIRVDSELLGPVGAVNVASFTLLGQTVSVDATTVFDESLAGGLIGLTPGTLVQVFAHFDPATGRYRATRVEPASALLAWHLRGPLAEVAPGAQTLRVGSVNYAYGGASAQPANLAAGQFVRLKLSAAGQPAGSFAVSTFGTALPALADVDGVKFRGLISAFVSAASFAINGRAVDASGLGLSGLGVGARIEVEGVLRNGVLRASKVTLLSDQQERERGFELSGKITAVDAAQRTFVLRGQTVGFGRADLVYRNGTAADLRVGAQIEVKGLLSADGRRVDATEIKFD